jgi:transposase
MRDYDLKTLYSQSLGIKAPWKIASVTRTEDQIHIRVGCSKRAKWTDPETKQRALIKDWHERTWRHMDTCECQTMVTCSVPRIDLKSGRTMMVHPPWAVAGGRFTRLFEHHIILLLGQTRTVRGAARLARVTEDQVDGVMRRAVSRGLLRRTEQPLKYIGIDEKAIRKGHRYATLLTDLENGRVIDLIEERTQQAAEELLCQLPEASRQSIEAVALDMWPAYINAFENILPHASQVFDRFHIAKHLNESVDKVRREEHRQLSAAGLPLLAGSKYFWLRKKLDLRRSGDAEFKQLLRQDLDTGMAWTMKQNFDRFWNYKSWGKALRFLIDWVDLARVCDLKPLAKVADMIDKHSHGIMNYLIHPITNAASEGMNSIIQSLKHSARGLPNFKSFRTRVLFFLGKLDLSLV